MSERVIWERIIDHDRIRQRNARFKMQFLIPALAVLLLTLILTGWLNALGVLLVLGIIGLLWGTTVRYKSLSDAVNPMMSINSGRLRLGEHNILIEDIKQFTTLATSIQTSILGKYSRLHIAKAVFRTDVRGTGPKPELVEFGWPNMDEAGLEGVRHALEREIPGKWVEPTDLVDADELPDRPRLLRPK